ncbi:MAG TPA: hypothetical protein ENI69_01105 [Rhodospirillales bacterium]|nr:hypothetical protein [Rhodospirillales bacterium]
MNKPKSILELNTGLFPDAETVAKSIVTCDGRNQIIHLDVTGSQADDRESWEAAAAAIISADLVVTL